MQLFSFNLTWCKQYFHASNSGRLPVYQLAVLIKGAVYCGQKFVFIVIFNERQWISLTIFDWRLLVALRAQLHTDSAVRRKSYGCRQQSYKKFTARQPFWQSQYLHYKGICEPLMQLFMSSSCWDPGMLGLLIFQAVSVAFSEISKSILNSYNLWLGCWLADTIYWIYVMH